MRKSITQFPIALLLIMTISCGGGGATLRVMAASSLTEAFQDMAVAFEAASPGVDVQLDFGGSQRLRSQLEFGARADIFASADRLQMEPLNSAGLLNGAPVDFAANSLVIISVTDGPVVEMVDLASPAVRLVLAQSSVPAGAYSRQILEKLSQDNNSFKAMVLENTVSEESNVRNVAQKVALGEADAGIVFQTDVPAAQQEGNIRVIEFPEEAKIAARYPMAVLQEGSETELAEMFLTFVLSNAGQRIMVNHGFSSP